MGFLFVKAESLPARSMGQCSLRIFAKDGSPGWKVITQGIFRMGSGTLWFFDNNSRQSNVRARLMPFRMQFFG